jgi:hypothetical protein
MYYVYSALMPFSILIIGYYLDGKPNSFSGIVNMLFKILIYLFAYTFLIYYLEMENYINSSWSFYTLIFFLTPISIITVLFKLYYTLRKSKGNTPDSSDITKLPRKR